MPTVSIAKGRGYLNHNDRSIDRVSEKSWDPELSRKNVICRNIPIQEAYNQIFGKALSEYNQRQIDVNHPERQIKTTTIISVDPNKKSHSMSLWSHLET